MAKRKVIVNDELTKVTELAGLGLSAGSIAASLGMSKATFDRRVSESEELKVALEKGRALANAAVVSTAFKMATSGESPSMTQFWLKHRDDWKENTQNEQQHILIEYVLHDGKDTDNDEEE